MKKQIYVWLVSIFFLAGFSIEAAEKPCSFVNETFIKKHVSLDTVTVKSKRPVNGLCEVVISIQNKLIPLYAGKDYIISGDLYYNRVPVTKLKIEELKRKIFTDNRKALDESVAFTYRPKDPKGPHLYLFVGPLCPYCQQVGKKIKAIANRYGATVKLVLYSVHGKEGKMKAVESVCRDFSFDEYIDIKWKKEKPAEKYQCEKGNALIAKAEKVAEILGIDGVPAFYLENGTFVNGADLPALEKALQEFNNKK